MPIAVVGPRPAWPFPFEPPPGPDDGDNHALAVNTTDGAEVVDSAFSLQWLSGGSLDQANRAYALAGCVDCTTVAVAFQALITTGPTDPVISQPVGAPGVGEVDPSTGEGSATDTPLDAVLGR